VFLARLGVGEVEVLNRNRFDPVTLRPMQQPDQRVSDLGVAVCGGAVELVAEGVWGADGVAVSVQPPRGEVIGVEVHPDHLTGAQRLKRRRRYLLALPARA
jgi:hypothetical protein